MENNFTIEEVKNFWDSVADIYESENKKVGYVHCQRYEKAIEYGSLEPGQTVLIVWSRMGGLIPYIRKINNLKLYNREVSPKFIEKAKKKFPNENFKLTDLENLKEFEDNNFDRIISLETLEHTSKPVKLLSEFKRVLKPDGKIIISMPPGGFEIPTRIWDKVMGNHGEGPHRFLWPKEAKKLIKESSLNLVQHLPFMILPLGNDKLERLSEKIMTKLFSKTFIINYGVRHFYICEK